MSHYVFGLGTTTGEECYDAGGVWIGCPWDVPRSGQPVLAPILTEPAPAPAPTPAPAPVPVVTAPPPPPPPAPVVTAAPTPVLPPPAPVTIQDHYLPPAPLPIIPSSVNVEVTRSAGEVMTAPGGAEPPVSKVLLYGAVGLGVLWLLKR